MSNVVQLKQATPDDLMTISQFAKKQGCSKSYIYKLKNDGKIRFYPRGYFKVSEKEVITAMES